MSGPPQRPAGSGGRSARQRRDFLRVAAGLGLSGVLPGAPRAAQDAAFRAAARRWVRSELTPSTLSSEAQMAEMDFFIQAARPFRGQRVYVASETLDTHVYEQRVLARAFREITGIEVIHDVIREGELVERLTRQMRTGRNLYDAYVNDSDFIGTHFRRDATVALSDWMRGEGAGVTLPGLDLDDFIGLQFTTGPDGKVYQLPDQQFANLYWFRHDWFQRPELRAGFRRRYGYELGVPRNWKAYEDIAEYFTEQVREIDGQRVYGHMDYGKPGPDLGWRLSDAWLAMAGVGDPGLPNGTPVDEWGLRREGCHPAGSSVRRGGVLDSPAAVYALRKYLEWLHRFAPPQARDMDFLDAGPVPGQGHIAQQIFWYTAFTAPLLKPGLAVVNEDGTPKWRLAPSPRGAYWQPGMKRGYQDCGAWTLLRSTPVPRRRAAWLYAQFTTCKSVSLKKTLVGLTPIRASDLGAAAMSEAAPRLGGLVELYRGPVRERWTPTGINVPDYARLAQLWWTRLGPAVRRPADPRQVMGELAAAQDALLVRLRETGRMTRCAPRLNDAREPRYWLERPGAPKPRLEDEEGVGRTMDYDAMMAAWRAGDSH